MPANKLMQRALGLWRNATTTDRIALVLTIVMLITYLSTMSISMDDEDGIHFAQGLTDFNIAKNQPHTPGFPTYIMLGRIFLAFTGDTLLALTSLSAVFGALTVLVVYFLSKEFLKPGPALLATIITAITPLFWLNSLQAMSDMAGMFFIMVSLLLFIQHMKTGSPRIFLIAALIAGISTGIRIHAVFILFPVILYIFARKRKPIKLYALGIFLFVIMILAWLLPVLVVTGTDTFVGTTAMQLDFWSSPDLSMIGGELEADFITGKLRSFLIYFVLGGYGIGLLDIGIIEFVLLVFILFLLILSLKKAKNILNPESLLILSSIVVYILFIMLTLPPFNPRYFLILVPFISIILSDTLFRIQMPDKVKGAIIVIFLILLLAISTPLAYGIHTEKASPVKLVDYIRANTNEDFIFWGPHFMDKYMSYYGVKTNWVMDLDCDILARMINDGKTVLSLKPKLPCNNIRFRNGVVERNPRYHIKRSVLYLQVIEPIVFSNENNN